MSFLMSLRRTTYVPPKFPPHRGEKRKMAVFRLKVHLSQKICYKVFFSVKTVSGKVVRHLLTSLSVQK